MNKNNNFIFVVFGFDPGSNCFGYSVVLLERVMPVFDLSSLSLFSFGTFIPEKNNKLEQKLFSCYLEFRDMIEKTIKEVSLMYDSRIVKCFFSCESQFMGKNFKSISIVIHFKTIIYLLSAEFNIPVFEFTPQEARKAVLGFSSKHCDKSFVCSFIKEHFFLRDCIDFFDESDSILIAIAFFSKNKPLMDSFLN
jgi:crossover junction endodeoxyribonuclease RuvC